MVVNYLLNLFLAKELLVSEITELSRTFNVKLFGGIVVTGASYKIYGSLENMFNAAWLKPLLTFALPDASLLYVLVRMPTALKDKLPRSQIELAVANWFKNKTSLQSIFVTEPIYTEDLTDRIDAVLFVGGFDTATLFDGLQKKCESLKSLAVEKGFMTDDWQVIMPKIEEPTPVELETSPLPPTVEVPLPPEEPKAAETPIALDDRTSEVAAVMLEPPKPVEALPAPTKPAEALEVPKAKAKPKRARKIMTKVAAPKRKKKTEKVEEQKKEITSA
jgi:hypothetical protein